MPNFENRFSRRYFFYGTLLAGAVPAGGFGSTPSLRALGFKSYNERLNVAAIGLGTRGPEILRNVAATENVVALCDVNDVKAAPAFRTYEKAKRYKDFRKMIETEGKNIDAVMVATPDHVHTPIALYLMQHGKHVYCEKPLTRTPWEASLLAEAAAKYKVATQMGNQGFSHECNSVAAEIVWAGDIGQVKEVYAWTGTIYGGGAGLQTAPPEEPVPSTLDWDLWLATAAERNYSPMMVNQWRAFQDFGTGGSLGDWGVHILGPVHTALQLGAAAPTSVECVTIEGRNQWTWPLRSHIRFEFPARGNMPPVTVNFYQDMMGDFQKPAGMAENERLLPPTNNLVNRGRPQNAMYDRVGHTPPAGRAGAAAGRAGAPGRGARGGRAGTPGAAARVPRVPGNGAVLVGDKGYMATSSRGEGVWLLPASRWAAYTLPPQLLPRIANHQQDWVRACKGGRPGVSEFGTAAAYIEWLALGAIALRVPQVKLLWDGARMRITNNREADKLVKPYIRKGWTLKV